MEKLFEDRKIRFRIGKNKVMTLRFSYYVEGKEFILRTARLNNLKKRNITHFHLSVPKYGDLF